MASKRPKPDERTPMLQFPGQFPGMALPSPSAIHASNYHLQFCAMVGMPPLTHPSLPPEVLKTMSKPGRDLLYQRAIRRRRSQNRTYLFTATLSNSLLLSQVVLGASVTALGASDSSRVLITLFGALNTIIAGLVAYLKSRGQPMRARMYAEDLDRLVDEIENSAAMWLGIAADVHGYAAIDTDDRVTVRGEVARLTRLWDAAVRRNVANDPDMYAAASPNGGDTQALRGGHGPHAAGPLQLPLVAPPALPPLTAPPVVAPSPDPVAPPPEKTPRPSADSAQPAEEKSPAAREKEPAAGPPPPSSSSSSGPAAAPEPGVGAAQPAPASQLAPPAEADPDASPASAPLELVRSASARRKDGEAVAAAAGTKANVAGKRSVGG